MPCESITSQTSVKPSAASPLRVYYSVERLLRVHYKSTPHPLRVHHSVKHLLRVHYESAKPTMSLPSQSLRVQICPIFEDTIISGHGYESTTSPPQTDIQVNSTQIIFFPTHTHTNTHTSIPLVLVFFNTDSTQIISFPTHTHSNTHTHTCIPLILVFSNTDSLHSL